MPRDPGPEDGSDLTELIARIARAARPVVLIDGGSGAGKSALADRLAPAIDAQLVRLDDLYPGWDGLEAGSAAVHETVLRLRDAGWTGWDWTTGTASGWHPVDPERPIVVEGSGALSRVNRALATFGIWIELDAAERQRRALARDGAAYSPHWDRWAAQERAFRDREHPERLADVVLAG